MTSKTNVKGIQETSWMESNQPTTVASVVVGNDFNIYNYKTSSISIKVANILSVGGTIILTNGKTSVTTKLEDEAAIHNYMLQQLEYLIEKYNKVTGVYAQLAWETFASRQAAKEYFQSEAWKSSKLYKLNALDALLPALVDYEDDRQLNILSWSEQKRLGTLWNGAAKARVFRKDLEKDIPNQEVTTAIQPAVGKELRIGEFGPYAANPRGYISTVTDEIEAKVVNKWYYDQPEFRVQTIDDKLQELTELRQWFQDIKDKVRKLDRNKVKPTEETLAKYERLEQLEFEVGTTLDAVPIHLLSVGQ